MTNRERGDYLERQTREALRAHGWIVVRAAGSHGVADIVALRLGFKPLLVSCKVDGKVPPAERGALIEAAAYAGARPLVAYREKRGYVDLALVTGDARGPHVDTIKVPPRPKE